MNADKRRKLFPFFVFPFHWSFRSRTTRTRIFHHGGRFVAYPRISYAGKLVFHRLPSGPVYHGDTLWQYPRQVYTRRADGIFNSVRGGRIFLPSQMYKGRFTNVCMYECNAEGLIELKCLEA